MNLVEIINKFFSGQKGILSLFGGSGLVVLILGAIFWLPLVFIGLALVLVGFLLGRI